MIAAPGHVAGIQAVQRSAAPAEKQRAVITGLGSRNHEIKSGTTAAGGGVFRRNKVYRKQRLRINE
jgi:hypothetical protein